MEFLRSVLSDQKHVKRNAGIQILMATLTFMLLIRAYPLQIVQSHEISKQQAVRPAQMDTLTGDAFTAQDKKLQTVYFSQEHLYRIVLYLNCTIPEREPIIAKEVQDDEERVLIRQAVVFRLYDADFSCIYEEKYSCRKIAKDGYMSVSVDMDVDTQQAYYYELLVPSGCGVYIELPTADRGALDQPENSTLYIDGIINDEVCLIADFDYARPLTVWGVLLYDTVIIAVSAALYVLVMLGIGYWDWRFSAYSGVMDKCVRIMASVLACAAAVFLFWFCVAQNKFGGAAWDRLFYTAAIVVGLLWIAGALWLPLWYPKKQKRAPVPAERRFSFIWRNYIQTVSFGFLFYALCQYVNAQREYHHTVNTRWMLIFLAIAFLMMLSEKQFLNLLSAVWLIAGAVCSAVYCGSVTGGENALTIARLTCGAVVVWGLLLLNILLQLRIKRNTWAAVRETVLTHRPQAVYAALWVVFILLMWSWRYEKVWVFTAVLPFLAMAFFRFTPAAKSRFLKNFTNGILLSFGLVVLFCLHHRPYHYWMRYGGMFHTVACTGMYLAVVLGAAVGKFYGRLRDKEYMLRRCFYELSLSACVIGFIILTMARTAFVTLALTVIMVAALAAVTYRKTPARVVRELGMLAGAAVVCFPVIFTAVRMVPAAADDPIRYDIEFQDDSLMIQRGDPIDSEQYMTIERFFSVFFGRFAHESDDAEALNRTEKTVEGEGLLAYTGNDFAGMEVYRAAEDEGDTVSEGAGRDISNGRFEIFKTYFKALGLKGHPGMGPPDARGEDLAHAHNSYLQVAYNFGMIAGVVFLSICALALWSSARLVVTQGRQYSIYMVPYALVVVFGTVSLTEWAFHPCIPAGFCFLILQVILMRQ